MKKFHLFDVFGVELEYMITHRHLLQIAPVADQIFIRQNDSPEGEYANGKISWSNELVSHVVELKTTSPEPVLAGLESEFQKNVQQINRILNQEGCLLLPSACHPMMDPFTETRIWPHDQHEIYELYNRIFDCRGHGWSNVQSTHLNLPFFDDTEFDRLHTVIRLILPALPALCASSPILNGKYTGYKDSRMHFYQFNQREIPIITGKVIPEYVRSQEEYQIRIFDPINTALSPFDEQHILDHHFVNSRGAIARFDRGAIEIRVMDIQECPKADLGIISLVVEVLKSLVYEEWSDYDVQAQWHENDLYCILSESIQNAEQGRIPYGQYGQYFGMENPKPVTFHDLWEGLFQKVGDRLSYQNQVVLEHILEKGSLSARIAQSLGNDFTNDRIIGVYQTLADCLEEGQLFSASMT